MNIIMKNNNSKKGFTLVEIMIVVVIIGLLAALAIPAFQGVRERSLVGVMDNDARQISAAAAQYFLENPAATSVTIQELITPATGQPYLAGVSDKVNAQLTTAIAPGANFPLSNPSVNGGVARNYSIDTGRYVAPPTP